MEYFTNDGVNLYVGDMEVGDRRATASEITAWETPRIMAQTIQHFTDVTTQYIEGKVQAYNVANGLAFKDIDAFTKYAINLSSNHNAIANQFIDYADKVWKAVRDYQSTATTIPTDAEFQAVLDGVLF